MRLTPTRFYTATRARTFFDYVQRELARRFGGRRMRRGGLRVSTTLDPRLQASPTTPSGLAGVVQAGTGSAAYFGRPVAGKTGTAEDFKDAWFCGYVPQLAACVWVGYPEAEIPLLNVAGFGEVVGGSIPARIWHDFMAPAMRDRPARSLPTPSASHRWLE